VLNHEFEVSLDCFPQRIAVNFIFILVGTLESCMINGKFVAKTRRKQFSVKYGGRYIYVP